MTEVQRAEYEKSKYLGGNAESTHLVKGLDFLLLQKIRAGQGTHGNAAVNENLDSELERLLDRPSGPGQPVTAGPEDAALVGQTAACRTALGQRVLAAALKHANIKAENRDLNELFLPARMYYQFHLDAPGMLGASAMTMRIRSQEEVAQMTSDMRGFRNDNDASSDRIVIAKVVSAIRAANEQRRRMSSRSSGAEESEELSKTSLQTNVSMQNSSVVTEAKDARQYAGSAEAALSFDSDDDIFADAGVDYEVTVGKIDDNAADEQDMNDMVGPAPLCQDGDEDDSSSDRDSGHECAVVAPYPESSGETDGSDQEDAAVTAPYPSMSVDNSSDKDNEAAAEAVTTPYLESLQTSDAKRQRTA
ncbi:hypothetical protein FB639_002059, partial [Coemansia asiatica]